MKKCPDCGAENQDNAKFCLSCGASLSEYNLRCPRCNNVCPPGSKFCPVCGYRFTSTSDCETKTFSTIDESKIDEETYLVEQKNIKQRVYNSKIKDINRDEISSTPSDKILEYNEDYLSKESKISPEKMLKIENKVHLAEFITSLLILIFGFVVAFMPLVKTSDGTINFINILITNWNEIVSEFSLGVNFFGNAMTASFSLFLQFIFLASFLTFSLIASALVLIRGLNDIKNKDYQHNFYLIVLPSIIIFSLILISIGFSSDIETIEVMPILYYIVSLLFLISMGGYNIYKVALVKNKMMIVRRSLLLVSFVFGMITLIILGTKILQFTNLDSNLTSSSSIYSYLHEILNSFNQNNNAISFYLGFVAYFMFALEVMFIALTTYYSYKMIKLYNHFKLYALLFSIFSLVLAILSMILFTISTFYSNLDVSYSLTIVPTIVLIFSIIVFFINLTVFVIFRDDKKSFSFKKNKKEVSSYGK